MRFDNGVHTTVPLSEVLDKIAILKVKLRNLPSNKHSSIEKELEVLETPEIKKLSVNFAEILAELQEIHEQAWQANDRLFSLLDEDGNPEDIKTAIQRSHVLNKQRIEVKNEIEGIVESRFFEQKQYN